ncbi:MAG: hypothetical protein LBB74_08760 [Chitinispirillales bacterium]|jgi:hypothetical protein|nr:hypothetical protein [Chitinispirillales bacterium]
MNKWTVDTLTAAVYNRELLRDSRLDVVDAFVELMNRRFPPSVFSEQLNCRRRAIDNAESSKRLLDGAAQSFPDVIECQSVTESSLNDLTGCAIVFTAGGDGERLRLSLIDRGEPEEALRDFTKATYPLKGFPNGFGALQINLAMVGAICREYGIDVPVIVTTGPAGSVTDRVIPEVINRYDNFGLSNVMIIPQGERLHFTVDERFAVRLTEGKLSPVVQPDETGGPLMALKRPLAKRESMDAGTNINTDINTDTVLQWLSSRDCEKLLIVQATAVYEPRMLARIATAARGHDCAGVGIPRSRFDSNDPFGTFAAVEKEGGRRTVFIIEQAIRNDETRSIIDTRTGAHLPLNTGLYAVDINLLLDSELPDYATPPKEVLPGIPRSPKVGYAATDLLPLAVNPVVLTVSPDSYAVIKNADDLDTLSAAARRFGLHEYVSMY